MTENHENPDNAQKGLSRRHMLTVGGASLLATAATAARPPEHGSHRVRVLLLAALRLIHGGGTLPAAGYGTLPTAVRVGGARTSPQGPYRDQPLTAPVADE